MAEQEYKMYVYQLQSVHQGRWEHFSTQEEMEKRQRKLDRLHQPWFWSYVIPK